MTHLTTSLLSEELSNSPTDAIICGDQTISYSKLFDLVSACSEQVCLMGIKPADRVGIVSPNSMEYIILLLSLWVNEAIACPLSTRLPHVALDHQLKQINAQYLFTSENTLLQNNSLSIKKYDLLQIVNFPLLEKKLPQRVNVTDQCEQKATILFTTGSSDAAKAVLHTLGNHIYSAKGSNELIPIAKRDGWLLSLPLYHVGGLSIIFRTLLFGGTIVIPNPEERLSKSIETKSVTHVSLVSTQLKRLLDKKNLYPVLKKLKGILIGGSTIDPFLLEKALQIGCSTYVTYGSTELASQAATSKYPEPTKALKHRKIKISKEGEILASGKTLFSGYVKGNSTNLPLTKNGWFATDDLGFMNDVGGLVITGRKDNMFISGGENIYPEEIERSLCQAKGVEEAIVVPIENAEFGFRPVAIIKTISDVTIKEKELVDALKKCLPKFKIPEQFYLWPTDISATSFKLDRQYFIKKIQEQNSHLKKIN